MAKADSPKTKSHQSSSPDVQTDQDRFLNSDQPDVWDITDPGDQSFWDEFFKIEELLDISDELDPATFSITIQNHHTGEVRTYAHVRLLPARRRIRC